jgi:hypothetical protein
MIDAALAQLPCLSWHKNHLICSVAQVSILVKTEYRPLSSPVVEIAQVEALLKEWCGQTDVCIASKRFLLTGTGFK